MAERKKNEIENRKINPRQDPATKIVFTYVIVNKLH